jgi:hypothetical protein
LRAKRRGSAARKDERDDIDKLLRYDAMISRQLNHATADLERLQAEGKGIGRSPVTLSILQNKAQEVLLISEWRSMRG